MEIKAHRQFEVPDDNSSIWRYMDFTKFVHLLQTNKLYFNRVDKFKDSHEGANSKFNKSEWAEVYKDWYEKDKLNNVDAMFETTLQLSSNLRKQTYVNCWHVNNYESAAMWDLYVKSGEGIAIKSSYNKLKECFNGSILPSIIGLVRYLDYDTEWMSEGNIFFPIFHKRKSFAHEQELRIIYHDNIKYPYSLNQIESPEHGIEISIDLDILIKEIYVSPDSPKWIADLVDQISKKYLINAEVIQSKLYDID